MITAHLPIPAIGSAQLAREPELAAKVAEAYQDAAAALWERAQRAALHSDRRARLVADAAAHYAEARRLLGIN